MYEWSHTRRIAVQFATALLFTLSNASAEDTRRQFESYIDSVEQSLREHPISDASLGNTASELLRTARRHAADARYFLSLETLAPALGYIYGDRAVADLTPSIKDGMAAFDTAWGNAARDLAAEDSGIPRNAPAALHAIAEASRARTQPLLEGARGFATATKPADGLFYLGQARGEAELARFAASLNLSLKQTSRLRRSMLPELLALQEKVNAAFQPPRSINLHVRFIALNSALKLARELDSSRHYDGSLYQYLEAIRRYAALEAEPPPGSLHATLRHSVVSLTAQLDPKGRDDSIARLFLERAASQVVHSDGTEPSPEEWRSARAIVEGVMPAYYAALRPPVGRPSSAGKTIEVTLVRWPYT